MKCLVGLCSQASEAIAQSADARHLPGSVLLLSKTADHNIPLGMRNEPRRTSDASAHSARSEARRSLAMFGSHHRSEEKKRTRDGKIILEPQPEESMNDPYVAQARTLHSRERCADFLSA